MSEVFDPLKYLISIRAGSPPTYLPVPARCAWMRSEHPAWGIETEAIQIALTPENNMPPYAIFRATIKDETGRVIAQATSMEDKKGFVDFLMKAETSAVGRALALCGYGTLNALDIEEGRIVDSPINHNGHNGRDAGDTMNQAPPTDVIGSPEWGAQRKAFYVACQECGVIIDGKDKEKAIICGILGVKLPAFRTPEAKEYRNLIADVQDIEAGKAGAFARKTAEWLK